MVVSQACFFFLFFLKIYLLTLERESMCLGGGAEGENLQADFPLSVEPDMGLDPMTHEVMT